MLASAKVGVHLGGQQRILGHVGIPRIFVEGQHKQPGDADDGEEGGEIGGQLLDARVAAQGQDRCYCSRSMVSSGTRRWT